METNSHRTTEVTPRPLLAVDLLQSFLTPTVDLIHNSAAIALFVFGVGMGDEIGLKASLNQARKIAKIYAATSCCNCALNAALTNFTVLNGKLSVISAGLAGCCTGIFRNFAFGFPHSSLSGCIDLSIPGLIDYVVRSRYYYAWKIPKPILSFQTTLVKGGFDIEKALKLIIVAATIGSAITHGVDLELWKFFAPDVREFSAITVSLLASSSLMLFALHRKKKDSILSAGAVGCWLTLLYPFTPFDGAKDVLYYCLKVGFYLENLKSMYSRGSYFLHLPRMEMKINNGEVLPPFTLLLPKKSEEGFSIFYKALIKSITKSGDIKDDI